MLLSISNHMVELLLSMSSQHDHHINIFPPVTIASRHELYSPQGNDLTETQVTFSFSLVQAIL